MKIDIKFQYLAPGASRPDDKTLPNGALEIDNNNVIPALGDIISISDKNGFRSFKVAGRNFVYGYTLSGEVAGCTVFITVTDVSEDEIGVDIKE
ncbi:hypothetical protein NDI49_30305 [Trichocoleus sp. ST-U3]